MVTTETKENVPKRLLLTVSATEDCADGELDAKIVSKLIFAKGNSTSSAEKSVAKTRLRCCRRLITDFNVYPAQQSNKEKMVEKN